MDQFSNDRNTVSSAWNSGNMQSFDNFKPVTSQVQPGDSTSKRNGFSDDHDKEEPEGCCNSVMQCSQETSFSGLKYVFASEKALLTRCEI